MVNQQIIFAHITKINAMNYDIYLTGTVGGWGISADYVQYVLNKKKGKPCNVAICSLGGYVTEALKIFELFREHGQVTCYFLGMTASAATFMAMGAAKVVMSKNSLILIHNAMGAVMEWGNMNKEQIDELVKRLQFQRSQLNTIDDVIAEIYAEKSGKSIEDVKSKMKVAAWIKASEAKEFGLVDEITDAKQIPADVKNTFSNNIIKDMGLPALPKGFNLNSGEENPTSGVLQKVVELLRGLMPETTTDEGKPMKLNIFTALSSALSIKDGFEADENGNVTLDMEQLKTVNDTIERQNEACRLAKETIDKQKEKITQLESDKTSLEEQVKNLKGSAEQKPAQQVEKTDIGNDAYELYQSIKDAL